MWKAYADPNKGWYNVNTCGAIKTSANLVKFKSIFFLLQSEHPCASTSDDVEGFISLLHHMLGCTFNHKTFMNSYRY